MLVPEVSVGVSAELASVREACDEAVATLVASEPDRVVVLGSAGLVGERDESAGGTLAPFGVDVRTGGDDVELPLSLTIGAWLLDRAAWDGPRTYTTGTPSTHDKVALLVMADGSAKRSAAAPGALDDRAEAFDAVVAAALGDGDAATLADLDLDLAGELWAAGAPALRTLGEMTKGADVTAQLRSDVAPFGVGYWVADWAVA